MEMMLLSFLLPAVKEQWGLQGWQTGFISASTFVGMGFGAWLWGIFSDKFGRRSSYLCTGLWTTTAGMLSITSQNWWQLTLWRCLVGFGVGGAHTSYTLLSEFTPTKSRGEWLLMASNAAWCLGAVIECVLAWGVLGTSSDNWRLWLFLSAVPVSVCVI